MSLDVSVTLSKVEEEDTDGRENGDIDADIDADIDGDEGDRGGDGGIVWVLKPKRFCKALDRLANR